MKTTTLFTLVLKIIGLIALWNVIQTASVLFSGISMIFMFMEQGSSQPGFVAIIAFNIISGTLLPAAFAYYCLMRTGVLVSWLKLDLNEELALNGSNRVLVQLTVLVLAIFLTANGAVNFLSYNYHKETKNEFVPDVNPGQPFQNKTFLVENETTNINYFAMVEMLLGILLLSNLVKAAEWVCRKYYIHDA